jgi:hypothetical protein
MIVVVVTLVDSLRLLETIANVSKELFALLNVPRDGSDPCVARLI